MTNAGDDERAKRARGADRPASSAAASSAKSTGDLHTYIGTGLRKAFDDIAKQPVPDRFLELMRELDKA